MSFNKFQTEWVFSHLLFPNSAQARDVFTYVTDDFLLSRKSENKNLVFFKKFVSIYLKTNTVQSNLFFSEFPQDNLKIWPLSFKKLSKEEIIILLGLTVYKLPITEISVAFNYSHLQIKNKIKKAIDIVSPKPENRLRKKYEFQHRKYDSGVQSDFFAYDSAMQLVFNENFTHDEPLKNKIQIEKKILEDSVFKNYIDQIQNFKNEINNLSQLSYELPVSQKLTAERSASKVKSTNSPMVYIVTAGISVIVLSILLYRPQFLRRTISDRSAEIVEIQQIKIDRHITDQNEAPVVAKPDQVTVAPTNLEKNKSPALVAAAAKVSSVAADIKKIAEKNKSGGLYRGQLFVTDVEQVTGAIKEKIIGLGGKKAGEVELGWMKNETTSYFHFSFPDENKADLEDYLKQFGTIKLVYEPHPRVMPKGQKRYILEIKQNE